MLIAPFYASRFYILEKFEHTYVHLLVSYHDGLRTQIPCALALGY